MKTGADQAVLQQNLPVNSRAPMSFLAPSSTAKWARLSGGAWLTRTGLSLPFNHWGEAKIWIPHTTVTACSEFGDNDLFGASAQLIDFANDSIFLIDNTPPTGDWRFETSHGVISAAGPSFDTTHTLRYHFNSPGGGGSTATVDWYLDGVLIATDAGDVFEAHPISFSLGIDPERCACEVYYFTDIKIGTSAGASDIFSDDFSGGLGNWTQKFPPSNTNPGRVVLVNSPAAGCPTITLSPTRGQQGAPVHLTGSGFAPDSGTTLYFDGLPIEAWAETTDGSGNITASFDVPHVFSSCDAHTVYLVDDQGNIGWALFFVNGAEKADGINCAVGGPLVAAGDPGTLDSNAVLDYIWHDGAHWILWQDPSSVEAPTTFPPPANHAMNATRISADGSSITDYPIDTGYKWNFADGSTSNYDLFHSDPCGGTGSRTRPVFQSKFYFSSWAKPIYDARFASDGTNLWVGIVTAETIPYPWLDNLDASERCTPLCNPGALNQFVDLGALTAGFTSFATSAGTGYNRLWGSATKAINQYASTAYPTTDAGESNSGYWSPPVAIIFGFDGGAFNRLGDIPAFYCPGTTRGYNHAHGAGSIIGLPSWAQLAPLGSFYSRISLAASPNEPGILHAVWAEGGDWGRCGQATASCERAVWDGGPVNRDYRINYTTWDTVGKLSDTDIAASHVDRTNWHFPYDQGTGTRDTGYTWPDPAFFAATGQHDLRDDNGVPLLFLGWQQTIQNSILLAGGPQIPPANPLDTHGNPWLDYGLNWADTIHVYDLSGGSMTLVQEITSDLYPDEFETEFYYPIDPTANRLAPVAPDALNGPAVTGVSSQGVVDPAFYISDVYNDPLSTEDPVYLVNAGWLQRWPSNLGSGGWPTRALYRVPVAMDAPFDYLDGDRQLDFTILKEGASHVPYGRWFSDPRVIWAPVRCTFFPGGGNATASWGGVDASMFDRICDNFWEALQLVCPSDPGPTFHPNPVPPGFHYDPDADSITYVAAGDGVTTLFEVVVLYICRRCRSCKCGTGLHIARRV